MIKGVKAMIEETKIETNYEYWIIIAWLLLILIGVMFLTIENCIKCQYLESTTILIQFKIMILVNKSHSSVTAQ